MPVTFTNTAAQLINSSGIFGIPVTVPGYQNSPVGNWSMSFWMKANWGSTAAPRARKSFVGIYGPVSTTPGLMAYYYNNLTLSGDPILQRADPVVSFDWGEGAPGAGVNVDQISGRWTGFFYPEVSGMHYFRTISDDGVRLWLADALVINQWVDQSSVAHTTTLNPTLTVGEPLPIRLEWYENAGYGVIRLQYRTSTSGTWVDVPAWNGTFGLTTSLVPTQTMTALQIGTSTGAGELTGWTYGGTPMLTTPTNFMTPYNDTWVHITYTFDGVHHILYLNGEQVATSTTTQIPGTLQYITLNGFYNGAASETDTHTVGNLIVYGRVLPPEEVKTIYTGFGNRHGDYFKCLARYEFNEGVNGSNVTKVLDLIGTSPTDATDLLLVGAGTAPKYTYDGPADSHRQSPSRT